MSEKRSRQIIERDIKDCELYLERLERDPSLKNPDFVWHKKQTLVWLKQELKELQG